MSIAKVLYEMIKKGGSKQDMLEAAEHYDLVLMEGAGSQDWSASSQAVRFRDGNVCSYCGSTAGPFAVDHVIPLAKGGTHWHRNLAVACRSCNSSKGAKSLSEWLFSLPSRAVIVLRRENRG